ncbi:MAG: hypothetical protein V4577_27125 [Bacteroidota bacterium]
MGKFIGIIVLLFFGAAGFAQSKINPLLGNWVIIRTISTDYPTTKEDSKRFVGKTITFLPDKIVAPKNSTFDGGCSLPAYQFKTVNALKYYDGDHAYLKLIGCTTTNIQIVETSCGLPFASIHVINNDEIDIGVDSYRYFLKRKK